MPVIEDAIMHKGKYQFMVDAVTKFHKTLYVFGWFHAETDKLKDVRLIDSAVRDCVVEVGVEHGGVNDSLGPNKGFRLQALRSTDMFDDEMELEFLTESGWTSRVRLTELARDRRSKYKSSPLAGDFIKAVKAMPGARVLGIGGRARSKIDRREDFPGVDYTVFDICPGDNVDVVGDAHELTKYFKPEQFDAIYSVSVFEHLLMPWKVVIEMNGVLKTGGIGLIHSHQTLGLHDMPWDFWRFSDTAWAALFNKMTGFEILEVVMDHEAFVLPFIYRESQSHAERSAGFQSSAVRIQKVGPPQVRWDVSVAEVISSSYPVGDDGRQGLRDFF